MILAVWLSIRNRIPGFFILVQMVKFEKFSMKNAQIKRPKLRYDFLVICWKN